MQRKWAFTLSKRSRQPVSILRGVPGGLMWRARLGEPASLSHPAIASLGRTASALLCPYVLRLDAYGPRLGEIASKRPGSIVL